MRQVVDIAKKLELTSIALGCLTRKELCTAFQRVNPNTVMTLQNSYNWQSGRSSPRNFSLFEDWATALGVTDGPHFIMSSSLDDFVRVLGNKFSLPDGLLELFDPAPAPAAPATTTPDTTPAAPATGGEAVAAWRNGALLRGSFLALSLSWSPMQRGQMLCGAITFDTDGGGGVSASYIENVLGRPIAFKGNGLEDGRTGQVALRCEANGATFLMAFHLPTLPGNLGGGVFAGNALYDPNSEPTASTILLLRNHDLSRAELEGTAAYHDLGEVSLADYLERLGYGHDPELAAERALMQLLSGSVATPLISMRRDALGDAAVLLDQRRVRTTGQS